MGSDSCSKQSVRTIPRGQSGQVSIKIMSGDRFTLLLLEPGEIYFQDLAVNYIYDETKALTEENFQRGWLKICSKSIVFVPIKERNKDPLLKFPLNDVSEIIGNFTKYFKMRFFSHVTFGKTSLL